MTGNSAPLHLGPDDLDAWLTGTPSPEIRAHVEECCTCLELVRAEEALAAQLAALPLYAPKADLADRVMASVYIPILLPFARCRRPGAGCSPARGRSRSRPPSR